MITQADVMTFWTMAARITQIQIGSEFIDGIMLPNGDFGITQSQITALFELSQVHATRDIKRLLGKGSELSQPSGTSKIFSQEIDYSLISDSYHTKSLLFTFTNTTTTSPKRF